MYYLNKKLVLGRQREEDPESEAILTTSKFEISLGLHSRALSK
jgi:hypothetical protein